MGLGSVGVGAVRATGGGGGRVSCFEADVGAFFSFALGAVAGTEGFAMVLTGLEAGAVGATLRSSFLAWVGGARIGTLRSCPDRPMEPRSPEDPRGFSSKTLAPEKRF